MIAEFDPEGSVAGLRRAMRTVQQQPGVTGLHIMACDANDLPVAQVDPLLRALEIPVFGGVFPGLLYAGQAYTQGTLVIGITRALGVLAVPDLSRSSDDIEAFLEEHAGELGSGETMIVWIDGLSSRIGSFVNALFRVFGNTHSYIGGGTGSISFRPRPCIISNQGMGQDAAVLAVLDTPCSIGVRHGWYPLHGPYRVTEATGNTIHTLDWRPAFDIYREVVEAATGAQFAVTDFFTLAKHHPFGLYREDNERVIRDPIRHTPEGALVCVGAVPQDAYVDIMVGTPQTLIAASQLAGATARAGYAGPGTPCMLFIDCISRALFLGDRFADEIRAVQDGHIAAAGALTLGEIANGRRDYLEFYNKTAVVGIMCS
jgi:hypothetical protein